MLWDEFASRAKNSKEGRKYSVLGTRYSVLGSQLSALSSQLDLVLHARTQLFLPSHIRET